MNYKRGQFGEIFSNSNDIGEVVIHSKRINTEAYHIRPGATVNVWFTKRDHARFAEIHIIVVSGKIEIVFPYEKIMLDAGETISFFNQENFNIIAVEESQIFSVNNMLQGEQINPYEELFAYIRRAEDEDVYLKGHNRRVSLYTMKILQAYQPNVNWMKAQIAGALHDIGKVRISPEILNKPGKLTDEEFAEIKKHPAYSYDIIKEYGYEDIAKLARWHHEKMNGTGYPDGISGDEIPVESRAMAVADVFDALTTSRSYRKKFTYEEAVNILKGDVERGALDGQFVDILIKLIDSGAIEEGVSDMMVNQEVFD